MNQSSTPGESRIGPLTLDWKVNVTAVVAFLVSVSALMLQAMGYWHGSIVVLHPIDKVLITSNASGVRFGARLVYTNDGAAKYNALVLSETVTLMIGGQDFRQHCEERGILTVENRKPVLKESRDAAPFMIPATELVTHEVLFAARENSVLEKQWRDVVKREQLVELLETAYADGLRAIQFRFDSKIREISGREAGNQETLSRYCTLTLDQGLIRRMKNEGWTSRTCQI